MCALNKLNAGAFFKGTLNKFIGINKSVNLTFILDSIPQTSPGYLIQGTTIPNPVSWNSNNIDLTLHKPLIANFTSLETAQLILHEGIHAEIFRKLISIHGQSNLNDSNFPALFTLYKQDKANYQHEFMSGFYIDLIGKALRSIDNNKFPIDHYHALAWRGLQGTTDWTNKTLSEQQAINSKVATLLLNRSKNNCDDL